mgnify:CR=1 FL=1
MAQEVSAFEQYLESARLLVLDELRNALPDDSDATGGLYELMLDYPLRGGKGLRPALCIATCRGLGGSLNAVINSAMVLELYHNAFLIHDDVEDGSELRRNETTLHEAYGTGIAMNVGDGMLAIGMKQLLQNLETQGVGNAIRSFDVVVRMSQETAEGQMMELRWIQSSEWQTNVQSYIKMVYKKTAWYSFIAPMLMGSVAASQPEDDMRKLHNFGAALGIAFQIQDDLLNLGASAGYGKEAAGDLWEGKHTLMLIESMQRATTAERTRAIDILRKTRENKTPEEVDFLRSLIDGYDGLGYAKEIAARYVRRAERQFDQLAQNWPHSVHRQFIQDLVSYVIARQK